MTRKCYLDLDGVMVDFDSEITKHTPFETYTQENAKEIWKYLEKVPNLFLNASRMPNSIELFDLLVRRFGINLEILTALPLITGNLVTAHRDKREWVANRLSPVVQVNAVQHWSHKKYFCRPNDILIDDSPRNIKDWESVGGIGILFDKSMDCDKIKSLLDEYRK